MQFNQDIRHAFQKALISYAFDMSVPLPALIKRADRTHASLARTEPKAKTKEHERGWSAKLSFKTHRKLVQQGYQVL
ncbi:hypothetical protein [Aquabacterium sp.]|uniref:hypothetical protein n=1 Tax=Aquabacterium sp. TaxID=1872578 RepID=UPI004037A3DF